MTSFVPQTPACTKLPQTLSVISPADIRALHLSSRRAEATPTPRSKPAYGYETIPATPETEQPLTAKQLRELRRLCRKTANRAEYEGRGTQIRQVAAILSMVSRFVKQDDVGIVVEGSMLEMWVEQRRNNGMDWLQEEMLGEPEVQELRRWDKQLKIWGRVLRMPQLREGGKWNSSSKKKIDGNGGDRVTRGITTPMPSKALFSPVSSLGSASGRKMANLQSPATRQPLKPIQSSYINVITNNKTGKTPAAGKRDWSSLRRTLPTELSQKGLVQEYFAATPVTSRKSDSYSGTSKLTPLRALKLW